MKTIKDKKIDEKILLEELKEYNFEPEFVLEVEREYLYSKNSIKGAQGYFLFCYYAEETQKEGDQAEAKNKAETYLSASETLEYFIGMYNIREYVKPGSKISLLSVGRKNIVIKTIPAGKTVKVYAVKFLKYLYFNDSAANTDKELYSEKFKDVTESMVVPKIEDSNKVCIVMQYFGTGSLEEYIEDSAELPEDMDRSKLGKNAFVIIIKLLGALQLLRDNNISHGGLCPSKILINVGTDDIGVQITDFGVNNIYRNSGPVQRKYLLRQIYVAPELSGESERAGYLADIYSMGIIAMEVLELKKIEREFLYQTLYDIGTKKPDLCQTIMAMIYMDPEDRLNQLKKQFGSRVETKGFELLKTNLEKQLKAEDYGPKSALLELFNKLMQIGGLSDCVRYILGILNNKTIGAAKYLENFAALTTFLYLAICAIFVYKMKYDPSNWPGYVVALSFAILASTYYQEIFGNVEVRSFSKKTEVWIRLNSFSFAGPILYTLLIDPKAWAICSGIGCVIVAGMNLAAYKEGERALKSIRKENPNWPLYSPMNDKLNMFQSWWEQMCVYGLALYVLQALIWLNLLKDIWFYALIVSVLVNIVIVFFNNATRHAPSVNFLLKSLYNYMKLEDTESGKANSTGK